MKGILAGLFLISIVTFAQEDTYFESYTAEEVIPVDYFSYPLDIPLQLSGTFGELRNNHFHAGLDIRTQMKEGLPIYAAADGFVNRVKVAHFGYGKALYIQHPNGYSTVYAHLKKYAGDIETYVKNLQYEKESYEVESFPSKNQLIVKKGDLIGYTGNSGSSGGPHLHFEIRDHASRPMNPKLFGIDIDDTRKPLINSVFVYPISDDSHVFQDANPRQIRLIPKNDGNFVTEKITAFGTLGFGLSANDQQNAANNRNGVFRIQTNHNGENCVDIVFDKVSFSETRYINRFIDYGFFKEKKARIQKLFVEKNNPLSIFKTSKNNGFVTVEDGYNSVYTILVSDFKGNNVTITVPIEGVSDSIKTSEKVKEFTHTVYEREGADIKEGKFTVNIPPGSFYDDVQLYITSDGNTLKFHEDNVPIHSYITLSADISNFDTPDKDKVFIGKLNYRGEPYYRNTERKGDIISARVRELGDYGLGVDTVAPTISPVNFSDGKWISNHKHLQIKIDDSQSGIKSYRATINGKWILMEYEYKKNLLTYDFEDHINSETENNLKLIVTDNVGNNSKFEATFFRK
ncbi:M23 family metallopeptidase [Planktosalinus lacus]|uniref:Peptidase M23 n=1 Tax=Planktosalinus lacus TaxID=1526573 RepID=A0A8J2VAQ1_9FLAO|nr:M23 family metallopeptidase [Planktosalinus lacus]GGD92831.1 peptidase M23 [Planktosalinus lacus]